MELQRELRRIRPRLTIMLAKLVVVVVVAACVVGYYFYFNRRPSQPIPAGVIVLLCAGCFYVGDLGAKLRQRFEIGRLMRRINR